MKKISDFIVPGGATAEGFTRQTECSECVRAYVTYENYEPPVNALLLQYYRDKIINRVRKCIRNASVVPYIHSTNSESRVKKYVKKNVI